MQLEKLKTGLVNAVHLALYKEMVEGDRSLTIWNDAKALCFLSGSTEEQLSESPYKDKLESLVQEYCKEEVITTSSVTEAPTVVFDAGGDIFITVG